MTFKDNKKKTAGEEDMCYRVLDIYETNEGFPFLWKMSQPENLGSLGRRVRIVSWLRVWTSSDTSEFEFWFHHVLAM